MPLYEHVVIARQDISPQQAEALNQTLKSIIEQGGGSVSKVEYWGLRSLAYRIKKNRKGHYSLLNIEAPAPAVAEMERQSRINEDILRYMTIKVDELEGGESVMMRNRHRGDDRRDDRRGGGDDRRGGRGDRGDRGDRGGPGGRYSGPREQRNDDTAADSDED